MYEFSSLGEGAAVVCGYLLALQSDASQKTLISKHEATVLADLCQETLEVGLIKGNI